MTAQTDMLAKLERLTQIGIALSSERDINRLVEMILIGAKELTTCLDVPRRVVINECIELAKSFGGTDGHKFVNGVVHALAQQLRPNET